MRFVIITGMSGAGKSTALKIFEDMGYFCVDNLPISLITKFAELSFSPESNIEKVAIGIDIRSGTSLDELDSVLDFMKSKNLNHEIMFFDAVNEVLIKRYKETRRKHPVTGKKSVEESIDEERKTLEFLRDRADYIIDTSFLLTREVKEEIENIFIKNKKYNNLYISIFSFGFKYGIPPEADLLFDVRFMPNPYYIESLKYMTGNDKEVREFVMSFKESKEFLEKLMDMTKFLIPNYVKEGKNQLVIGIGCTGGRHRSVTIANELYSLLDKNNQYGIKVFHRDIKK